MQQFYRNGKQLEWDSEKPVITCLMSVYNGQTYLIEAIDSILDQTYTNFEFLIINDASTDESVTIIESYDDPRIRLIHNEENIGLTKSLNKGIDLARGEYIARMDADDVSLPERFERQLVFCLNNKVKFCGANFKMILKDGTYVENKLKNYDYKLIQFFQTTTPHPSFFFKKEIIEIIGNYNEQLKYSQDFDFLSRFVLFGFNYLKPDKVPLIIYRFHDGQISNLKKKEQEYNAGIITRNNLNKMIKINLFNVVEGSLLGEYYTGYTNRLIGIKIFIKLIIYRLMNLIHHYYENDVELDRYLQHKYVYLKDRISWKR